MTTTPATQAGLFPRIVTHEQARQAAKNFIDAHFNNPGGKGVMTGIPARDDHDDIVLTDYIKQQAAAHSLPGDVGMREALEEIRQIEPEELYGIPDRCTGDRPGFQTLDAAEVFRIIDAALTPSALSGEPK